MSSLMFANLPVHNLATTRAFYESIGFSFNPQFSSEDAACMVVSETNYVMLLEHARFSDFIDKPISDTRATCAALISISLDSADAVRAFCELAFKNGARNYKAPQDLGFMFAWGFEDPDGNILEPFWMDPAAVQGSQQS